MWGREGKNPKEEILPKSDKVNAGIKTVIEKGKELDFLLFKIL